MSFKSPYLWGKVFVPAFLSLVLAGCPRPPEVVSPPPLEPPSPPPVLEAVEWSAVEGWWEDDLRPALSAFRQSCRALERQADWREVCTEARLLDAEDPVAARHFFQQRFLPYQVNNANGTSSGLITGYYVPDLPGSRQRSEKFRYPIYGLPEDLLVIDLGQLYPELKNQRLRGRVEGRRVVPYFSRAEIDGGQTPLTGKELFWVECPVELFFLHIQGSGRIRLENGESILVNYADQNGHPYHSLGRILIERQELTADQMSMQKIKAWASQNPDKAQKLLFENPSYIFFRELSPEVASPPGSLGVPLTAERSLAVDRRFIPLGAPVFLATTRPWPEQDIPLRRLMVAQDTGGAIKGAVRGDFFWGFGAQAGELAGRMKQQGRFWVLLPRGAQPPLEVAGGK